MEWLSDRTLAHLREVAHAPDLSGTRYRLLGQVGRGGMGSVFLVEDLAFGRRVALKVLDVPDARGDLTERLEREARILARLEHPGIVPVHDVGRLADGRAFYVMKLVAGERLDHWVATKPALRERLQLFQRICETVAFAHDRGVLHRDLKPENMMVGPFGEVLVMDWGVAKLLGAAAGDAVPAAAPSATAGSGSGTEHGAVLGTPGYMAPEQARGEVERLDARADVHALGAVLRFLLAGPDAPRPLRAICAKAMAASPEDRFATALDLAADVARYLDGRRVESYPEGLWHKAVRLYSRHKVAFWLILTYVVVRGTSLIVLGR